jgi:hypothetical protein
MPLAVEMVKIDMAREGVRALPWSRQASRALEQLDERRDELWDRAFAMVSASLSEAQAEDQR